MKVYECHNESCTLGNRFQRGRFTGGASKELILTLTGNPDPEKSGEGVCPACGEEGVEYTAEAATENALKAAEEAYDAQVKAIKSGDV